MPYLFLFSVVVFSSYFIRCQNLSCGGERFRDHDILALSVLLFVCILFFGLRYNVGKDYLSYYNNAEFHLWDKPQKGTGEYFEPTFRLLYWIGDVFELPSHSIFLLSGSIIYLFLFAGIKNHSDSISLSFFIFFSSGLFFFSFNELRQFIAVVIVFYAYRFCVEKRFFCWLIFILLAMSFHKSAGIIFPLYFFSRITLNKTFINTLLFLAPILREMDMMILLNYIIAHIPGAYSNYAEVLLWFPKSGGSGVISYLYLLMCFVMNNCRKRSYFFEDSKYRIFSNLFFLSAFFVCIFSSNYLILRLLEYLLVVIVVVFPRYMKASKSNLFLYIISLMILVIFCVNFIKYIFFSPSSDLLHYQTIFSR